MFDIFKIEENWVVFNDLFSKNYNGDSIRPVAQELRARRPDLKFFFCCKRKNKVKHIDMADEVLVEKSLYANYITSKAKYIISPMGMPRHGEKRKGQILVETWHGSPIKKIYLSRDKKSRKFQRYVKQFANVDLFCNQGDIHAKNLIEALNLNEKSIINCGLPRNDILFNKNDKFKMQLKEKLGLPPDKKVILYCPTWRRYDHKAVLPFSLDNLRKELKDEHVLLMRSHVGKHAWVDEKNNKIDIYDGKFVFNGGEYPDITHLYLISDILISDYSSAIFDFAITRKPQILFIYDYEQYKEEFNLYYDYNSFSPFPKVKNEAELINAIKNYPDIQNNYEDFVSEFLQYENGSAAKNLVDKMFAIDKFVLKGSF